jgi:hypothetical protein
VFAQKQAQQKQEVLFCKKEPKNFFEFMPRIVKPSQPHIFASFHKKKCFFSLLIYKNLFLDSQRWRSFFAKRTACLPTSFSTYPGIAWLNHGPCA